MGRLSNQHFQFLVKYYRGETTDLPMSVDERRQADYPRTPRRRAQIRKRLSPDQRLQMIRGYELGTAIPELATRYGVSRHTAWKIVAQGKSVKRQLLVSGQVLARAQELRAQGWSYKRIGKELGVAEATVHRGMSKVEKPVESAPAKHPPRRKAPGAGEFHI